jgi:hypothetical protein
MLCCFKLLSLLTGAPSRRGYRYAAIEGLERDLFS